VRENVLIYEMIDESVQNKTTVSFSGMLSCYYNHDGSFIKPVFYYISDF
jgi:hypothetical protein